MIKVALLAATVLVAASTAMATNLAFESGAPPLSEASCHLVQSLDLGCALRIVDASNDGTISSSTGRRCTRRAAPASISRMRRSSPAPCCPPRWTATPRTG
jgi:hypothetical protein